MSVVITKFRVVVAHILSLYLAWVFIAAAAPKLAHPLQFATDLGGYGIFPPLILSGLTVVVPWLEVTLGAAIVLRPHRAVAAAIFLLILAFTFLILYATLIGLDIPCGCGGGCAVDPMDRTGWPKVMWNTMAYLAPALVLTLVLDDRRD